MQKVSLGDRVSTLGIKRSDIAEGVKGVVYVLDKHPQMKNVAYVDSVKNGSSVVPVKKTVEVTQDLMFKYGLRPRTVFYFLVARLDTDMSMNIVSNKFVVEYVQVSSSMFNDLSDAAAGNPKFNCFIIKKEKKTVDGKDLSFVKPIAAEREIPAELQAELDKLSADAATMDSLWSMVDLTTSIKPDQFLDMVSARQALPGTDASVEDAKVIADTQKPKQLSQPAQSEPQPASQQGQQPVVQPTAQPAPQPERDDFNFGDDNLFNF